MPDETPPSTPASPTSEGPAPAKPTTPSPPARKPRSSAPRPPKAEPKAASDAAPAKAPDATRPAKSAASPRPVSSPPRPPSAPPAKRPTVVDASDLILGRAASLIAKRLMNGESIVVVNAERSVVTGDRAMVLDTYRAHRARGSKRSGPHYPRYPDRIFRRTVRGMLPHLKTRGKEAFDRLEVFIGIPPAYQGVGRQSLDDARARPALRSPLSLEEISRLLGARL